MIMYISGSINSPFSAPTFGASKALQTLQMCDLLLIDVMDLMKRVCGFKIVTLKCQDASEVSKREWKQSIISVVLFKVLAVILTFFLSHVFFSSSPPSLLETNGISHANLSFSVVFARSRSSSSHSSELSSWEKCYISILVLVRTEHWSHGFEWCVPAVIGVARSPFCIWLNSGVICSTCSVLV